MNKIVLLKVRDLPTEENIEPSKDYKITLIAQRKSEEKLDSNTDDEYESMKYRMEVLYIEEIIDLKTNTKIKIEKGLTQSQKNRFVIEQYLGDEYDSFCAWWRVNECEKACEKYRENNRS